MVIKQTRCTLNHTNAQYLIFMLGPSFQKHNSPHSDHDKNNAILTLSKSVLHWFIVLCPPAKFWSFFVQYFTEIGHLRHSKKILSVIFFYTRFKFQPLFMAKITNLFILFHSLRQKKIIIQQIHTKKRKGINIFLREFLMILLRIVEEEWKMK